MPHRSSAATIGIALLGGAILAAALLVYFAHQSELTSEPGSRPKGEVVLQRTGPSKDARDSIQREAILNESHSTEEGAPKKTQDESDVTANLATTFVVVDARTGAPCPRASVAVVAHERPLEEWKLRSEGLTPFEIARTLGRGFLCDESGRFSFTWHESDDILLFAACGKQSGIAWESRDDGPAVRELPVALPWVCVRVLDERGTPLIGAPVALYRAPLLDLEPIALAWSDRDGIAALSNDVLDAEDRDAVLVAAAWPLARTEPLTVPMRPPPSAPVELVIPVTGSLLVRARDQAGGIPSGGWISLMVEGEEEQEKRRKSNWISFDDPLAPLSAGVAEFRIVGLDQRFALRASVPGHREETFEVEGPTRSEPQREVELLLHRRSEIRARLVDAGGAALAGVSCAADIDVGFRYVEWSGDADERGEIRIFFDPPELRLDESERALRLYANRRDEEGAPWWSCCGRFTVPRSADGSDLDLGTLSIPTDALIAEGLVLDVDGRPVSGAELYFEHLEGEVDPDDDVSPILQSNREGRFRLAGEWLLGARRIGIDARTDELLAPLSIACERGTQNVELRLVRAAAFSAEVHLPKALDRRQLRAYLDPANGEAVRGEIVELGRGSFRLLWDSLRPGIYSFRLCTLDLFEPVAQITDVVIRAGERERDPRLNPLDLRDRVRSATLTFTAEDAPDEIDSRYVTVSRLNLGSEPMRIELWAGRHVLCLLDGAPAIVDVFGPSEYLPERIENVDGDRRVVLRSAPLATIEVENLPSGTSWALAAEHLAPGGASHGRRFFRLENARCSLPVNVPGEYAIELHGDGGIVLPTAPPSFVAEGKPGERVRLRFDQAAYDQELRTRKK